MTQDKDTPHFDGRSLRDAAGNVLNLKDPSARNKLKNAVPATKTWRSQNG